MSTTVQLRHGERTLEVTVAVEGEALRGAVGERAIEARRLASSAPPYTTGGAVVQEIAFTGEDGTQRAIVARYRDRILVALHGRTYVFVAGEDAGGPSGAAAGTGKIAAPMPGKVIAVLVQVGDRVAHGQPVLVIEAMKMETTLTADVDGEVVRVLAVGGETVDGGVILVEITPA